MEDEVSALTDPLIRSHPKSVMRQELYELAWQEPMLRVAERFGVSSSYLSRVCTELRVPRPPPGYWAQREFGKAPPTPELPPARPGDLTEWSPGTAVGTTVRAVKKAIREAKVNGDGMVGVKTPGTPGEPFETSSRKKATAVSRQHELLTGVKPHFLKSRKVENDILRPFKKLLVDILTSEAKLDEALEAAQKLFETLNRRGFHVGLAPVGELRSRAEVELLDKPVKKNYTRTIWSPERPTVVYVGATAIGLTIFELTEEVEVVYVNGIYIPVRDLSEQQLRRYTGSHHWRSKEERASGRLCLQAYIPSGLVKWSRRWPEIKAGTFLQMIPSIVEELESIAPELASQLAEARVRAEAEHRRWEEERRQWKVESERLRREKLTQESKRDLLEAIASWDEARRVWDYFESVEAELAKLPSDEAALIRERLHLGKQLVGVLEPLAVLKSWKTPDER